MARPSAASSRIEPRLSPVNSTPSRSPQARLASMWAMARCSAAFTSASGSSARRWLSSSLTSGLRCAPSASAAARRWLLSSLASQVAARTSSSCARTAGDFSLAKAASISGKRDASGSLSSARAAARRTGSWALPSCSAACAASSAARIRLLLITSSASAGSAAAAPVTGSCARSPSTTSTCPPASLTASLASASTKAAVRASAVCTAWLRAAMRASVESPAAMARACSGVSAWAPPASPRASAQARRSRTMVGKQEGAGASRPHR